MIKICRNRKPASIKQWAWQLAFGPASLLDGMVETVTLGMFGSNFRLIASRNAAIANIEAHKRLKITT